VCKAGRGKRYMSVVGGLVLSGLLAYLAVRGVAWSEVLLGLRGVRYGFLLLTAGGVVASLALRAWRWAVILRPVQRVRTWPLFAITAVGYLAILAIPFRIGEVVRPVLLAGRERVPLSSAVASLVVERCLDGLAFAALVVTVATWIPLPDWARPLGYGMGGAYLLLLGFLAWAWLARERGLLVISRIAEWTLPSKAAAVGAIAQSFVQGLRVLPDFRNLATAILLSGGLWFAGTGINYASFFALGLDLPLVAAATLQVLLTLGVLLPAAPASVGSFHFFAVMGLRLFGVPDPLAVSYAILVHATSMLVHAAVGIGCGLALQVTRWRKLESMVPGHR